MPDPSIDTEFARVRALAFEPYSMFRVPPMSGQYVNVSAAGYRNASRPLPWPPDGDANVFVFGGSTAFGYGVADAETIPAQLGERLGAAVYNFATPNSTSTQERIRFEQMLLQGHYPRAAVFIDGFSDLIAPYYQPLMFAPYADALNRHGIFRRRKTKPQLQLPDAASVIDQYARNARLINSAAREFGVRPVLVWQPVPCYEYSGPAEDHGSSAPLIECVRSGYDLMKRRTGDVENFLWLADMQRGRTEALYVDPDHYTAAFSGEIASRISRHLVDSGWTAA